MSLQDIAHSEGVTVPLYLLRRTLGSRGFWFLAGMLCLFLLQHQFDFERMSLLPKSQKTVDQQMLDNFIKASIERGQSTVNKTK